LPSPRNPVEREDLPITYDKLRHAVA